MSTVSTFCLSSQSIRDIHAGVIDEEEYQQFGSESDDEFSTEITSLESRNDSDEVQSLSASVSGRLSLRPRPVFPYVQAQVSASRTPTQAELLSQTEASKPSNDQPSGQSSTPKEHEELYFDLVKNVDSTLSFNVNDQIKDFYTR